MANVLGLRNYHYGSESFAEIGAVTTTAAKCELWFRAPSLAFRDIHEMFI
jgi:hypothetical protein